MQAFGKSLKNLNDLQKHLQLNDQTGWSTSDPASAARTFKTKVSINTSSHVLSAEAPEGVPDGGPPTGVIERPSSSSLAFVPFTSAESIVKPTKTVIYGAKMLNHVFVLSNFWAPHVLYLLFVVYVGGAFLAALANPIVWVDFSLTMLNELFWLFPNYVQFLWSEIISCIRRRIWSSTRVWLFDVFSISGYIESPPQQAAPFFASNPEDTQAPKIAPTPFLVSCGVVYLLASLKIWAVFVAPRVVTHRSA